MKNIIIIFSILFIGACSTVPKIEKTESLNTLIEKPEFNINLSSLPKKIKIYFYQMEDNLNLPPEIQGFITNSFFYNDKISYKPKISFSPLNVPECGNQVFEEELIIVFDLQDSPKDTKIEQCLRKLPRSKTLYVSKNKDKFGFTYTFIASREEEKNKLIKKLSESSERIILIDSNKTQDKEKIIKSLLKSKKEVVEATTYEENLSSQDMFAKLLMVNRSQERKRKLSRRISESIRSDSRTREDIDTFFLSVDLQEARNLKPALDYIAEKEFEVYILNSWQTKNPYYMDDVDLSNSIHSDFPIMMPIKMPEFIDEEKRSREFAIGYDLYEIILWQYGTLGNPDYIYKGLSGRIVLNGKSVKRIPYIFKITDKGVQIL